MVIKIDSSFLEVFLPQGTLEWFDIVNVESDENDIKIILEERNILPVIPIKYAARKITSKGFYDITITDFPIRGKRALLTFRRRRWKIEGVKEILKRDIKLSFPGTQLEKEFADFLKEDGGRGTILAGFYCKVSAPPSERI
ncbi:MAG: hypothetical protein HQ536_05330 [Parcubacteria group bacterium]|nr:hypothetical protein [Parcubacteria group bacterium]